MSSSSSSWVRIALPNNWKEINTQENPISVFICVDKFMYLTEVRTIQNIQYLMKNNGMVIEGKPFIVVQEAKEETIFEAATAFAKKESLYSLKLHNICHKMDLYLLEKPNVFEELEEIEITTGYQNLLLNKKSDFNDLFSDPE